MQTPGLVVAGHLVCAEGSDTHLGLLAGSALRGSKRSVRMASWGLRPRLYAFAPGGASRWELASLELGTFAAVEAAWWR